MPSFSLFNADCLDHLRTMEDCSVHSIVTDPPYGISFMGKKWDYDVPSVDIWKECLRVLKPGGHLLAFAGTRTQHRMAVNIEDAGFEIRDLIAWVYGQGFPKSMDVSKAIDKAVGAEREVVGRYESPEGTTGANSKDDDYGFGVGDMAKRLITAPATAEAQQWAGWGTALKPALEPITMARKPFSGTVAANVLEHGTGALNVDGCRVEGQPWKAHSATGLGSVKFFTKGETPVIEKEPHGLGRWPANLIHDGSEEVVGLFPEAQSGARCAGTYSGTTDSSSIGDYGAFESAAIQASTGSAARFFYCPKVSKRERGEGNNHPTVKPIALMAYLCRLVTPPDGIVLDPFMGSGSTGIAALQEGFSFIGIEREAEYIAIAQSRIEKALEQAMLR